LLLQRLLCSGSGRSTKKWLDKLKRPESQRSRSRLSGLQSRPSITLWKSNQHSPSAQKMRFKSIGLPSMAWLFIFVS